MAVIIGDACEAFIGLTKDLLLAFRGSEFKNNVEVFSILQNGIADEELWKAANEMIDRAA